MMANGQLWIAVVFLTSRLSAQQVHMNNSSLKNIPINQTENFTEFFLSHNSIVMSISDIKALEKYPRLRVLDLSHNLIEVLPVTAFDSLKDLEILNLQKNRLHSLPKIIFKELSKLKTLILEDNPWNCSCPLLALMKHLNESGVLTATRVTCDTPEKLAGKTVLDEETSCSNQPKVDKISINKTTSTALPKNSVFVNGSHEEFTAGGGASGMLTGSNSWKFLLGVVVITVSTSMLIVCAVKSPSWYKLLFNYRHQRLCEEAEPNILNTERYSNFSLDTEQTETSIQDLDESTEHGLSLQPLEDDDGFIEDGYIETHVNIVLE